jgi:TonB family protein
MRTVATIAALATTLTFAGGSTATADLRLSDQGPPPRDPRPGVPRAATAREEALRTATAADPSNPANWIELARLQEERGALTEAEGSLGRLVTANGSDAASLSTLASFFMRTNQFDKGIAALEEAASRTPGESKGYQLVATYYMEKVQRDASLSPEDKRRYVDAGIAATDRALSVQPQFVDSLVYKSILLRMQGGMEADPGRRDQLLAEADALRARAMEFSKSRSASAVVSGSSAIDPAPPPPPAAPASDRNIDGQAPIRVGGSVTAPAKIRNVAPVYPAEAMQAGVSGMVILEAVIDTLGNVRSATVLRSIPLLDQAAIEAVRQWQFTPTLLNGVPVPLIMTVTVNFTLE